MKGNYGSLVGALAEDPTKIDMQPNDGRIQGITNHGHIEFDAPLVSYIDTNLWQGGCFNGTRLNPAFKHIISLYPWERYTLSHGDMDTELYITMYDATNQGMDQVDAIAHLVNECRKTASTLVHCQAGLNRSSLIVARALFLDGAYETGDEIVDYLRAARSPAVLCNPTFEAEVRSWKHTKRWLGIGWYDGDDPQPIMTLNGRSHVYTSLKTAEQYRDRARNVDRVLELDFSDSEVTAKYV